MAHRHAADLAGIPLEEALSKLATHRDGPILLVEPADNIGGGAPGDLTTVLRGLLEYRIGRAGVIVNDPQAVQALRQLGPGERRRLSIGGRSGALGAAALELEAELLSTSDGTFTLEDPHSHQATAGRTVEMGPCAVIRSAGVTMLLTSRPTAPFDLAQWRSQGIAPEGFFAIAVKAAVARRHAYDPIAAATYVLNTLGPCAPDLRTLPFSRLRRPIYPLDAL